MVVSRSARSRKGTQGLPDARLHIAHGRLERLDLPEVQLEQETVMLADSTTQRLDQRCAARFETPGRELDELLGIGLAADQRFQNRSSALPEHARDDSGQLDVSVFERLLNALRVLRDLAHELLSCARQVAQL